MITEEILTLYLSTMGNLTGPSLDLFKFGKLSKCGMKGKPLESQIKKKQVSQKEMNNDSNQKEERKKKYVHSKKLKDLRIPGAKFSGLFQVGPCQSRTWHKMDVFLGVKAHLLQKWH